MRPGSNGSSGYASFHIPSGATPPGSMYASPPPPQAGMPTNIFAPVIDPNNMSRIPSNNSLPRMGSGGFVGQQPFPLSNPGQQPLPMMGNPMGMQAPLQQQQQPPMMNRSGSMGGMALGLATNNLNNGMPMMPANNLSPMNMGPTGMNVSSNNLSPMMPSLAPQSMPPAGLSPMSVGGGLAPMGSNLAIGSNGMLGPTPVLMNGVMAGNSMGINSMGTGVPMAGSIMPNAMPASNNGMLGPGGGMLAPNSGLIHPNNLVAPIPPMGPNNFLPANNGMIPMNSMGPIMDANVGSMYTLGPPQPPPMSSADAALELAMRQSLVESQPRWMVDPYYRATKEAELNRENDDMLEKAIRESLDQTNVHRLRQDEIERTNRILQQTNEKALEDAIRASLQEASGQGTASKNRSNDAIEQANEEALQRALMQSMQEAEISGNFHHSIAHSRSDSFTMSGSRNNSSNSNSNRGNSSTQSSMISNQQQAEAHYMQQNLSRQRELRDQRERGSDRGTESSANSYVSHGPSSSNRSVQSFSQQQGPPQDSSPPDPYHGNGHQQRPQHRRTNSGFSSGSNNNINHNNHQYNNPQQSRGQYRQQPPAQYLPQSEGSLRNLSYSDDDDEDDDDEYDRAPARSFVPGQQQGVRGDGETVVSGHSANSGIGRNTSAQVTALYMSNPELIEQEAQQRYQRQYQLYLQQQLARENSGKSLSSSSQNNQRLADNRQEFDHDTRFQQQHMPPPPSYSDAENSQHRRQQQLSQIRNNNSLPTQSHSESEDSRPSVSRDNSRRSQMNVAVNNVHSEGESASPFASMHKRSPSTASATSLNGQSTSSPPKQMLPPVPAGSVKPNPLNMMSPNQAAFLEKFKLKRSQSLKPSGAGTENVSDASDGERSHQVPEPASENSRSFSQPKFNNSSNNGPDAASTSTSTSTTASNTAAHTMSQNRQFAEAGLTPALRAKLMLHSNHNSNNNNNSSAELSEASGRPTSQLFAHLESMSSDSIDFDEEPKTVKIQRKIIRPAGLKPN